MIVQLNIFLLLSIKCIQLTSTAEDHISKNIEGALIKHLLQDPEHQPNLRPLKDPMKAIVVAFNINLIKLLELDERNQRITLQVGYDVGWMNEILHWNPLDYDMITMLQIRPADAWKPDITLINNDDAASAEPHKGSDYVTFFFNGWNMWKPKITLKGYFKVNVRNFPFDIQKFTLRFRSWNLNEDQLKIVTPYEFVELLDEETVDELSYMFNFNVSERKNVEAAITGTYIPFNEWELLNTEKDITKYTYRNYPTGYTEIRFTYTLARRPLSYIVTAIIPVIILVAIIVCSYFLPANSGERMEVLITVLLAFTLYLQLVNSSLPPSSKHTPMLSIFYLTTMIECVLSFLGSCLVMRLIRKGEENNSVPPAWVRKYITESTHKTKLAFKTDKNGYPRIDSAFTQETRSADIKKNVRSSLKRKRITDSKHTHGTPVITLEADTTEGEKEIRNCLATIVDSINNLKGALCKEHQIDGEWNELAEMLDRACCVVFVIGFLVISLATMLPISIARYNFHDNYHYP